MFRSLLLSAALTPLLIAPAFAEPVDDSQLQRVHGRAVTIDTHVDIPLDFATTAVDPGGLTASQVDLPKMRAGGLDAAFFIVYTPHGPLTAEEYAKGSVIAETRYAAIDRMTRAYPDEVTLARTAKDVTKIARTGKRVALIGMENAYPLGPSVEDVAKWKARGVSYMGITHFGHNQFGDSSNPDTDNGDPDEKYGGLSELGEALVAELNRTGIMVDVSHAGKKTMMQALALSTAPIIASHSGVKAIAVSPRNLDDEQLLALKEKGGVVQIVALDVYVKPLSEAQKSFRENIRKEMGVETSDARRAMSPEMSAIYDMRVSKIWEIEPRATVADFVNHIDHAVKIAGIDHVGIASDFDGGGGIDGWDNATETPNVTRELMARGYSETDIRKLWGGNLLRVMRAVEKAAE